MTHRIEGIYKDGKVELLEAPNVDEPTRVIVTFLTSDEQISLRDLEISEAEAIELRFV